MCGGKGVEFFFDEEHLGWHYDAFIQWSSRDLLIGCIKECCFCLSGLIVIVDSEHRQKSSWRTFLW